MMAFNAEGLFGIALPVIVRAPANEPPNPYHRSEEFYDNLSIITYYHITTEDTIKAYNDRRSY